MFIPLGSLLKNLPSRRGAPNVILALQVRQVAKDSLKNFCGDLGSEILNSVKISSFKNGALIINATPLVCAELQMRSSGLIEDINRMVGRRVVRRLMFRVS